MGLLYRPLSHNKVFIIVSIVLGVPFLTGTIRPELLYLLLLLSCFIYLVWTCLAPGSCFSELPLWGGSGNLRPSLRMSLLVSLPLTLTGALGNGFCCHLCKRLGAEAEGSVRRRSHSTPPSVVPLEHFCVGRNSCWTVALTPTLNDPRPGPGCTSAAPCLPRGRTVLQAGLGSKSKDYCRHLPGWFS